MDTENRKGGTVEQVTYLRWFSRTKPLMKPSRTKDDPEAIMILADEEREMGRRAESIL